MSTAPSPRLPREPEDRPSSAPVRDRTSDHHTADHRTADDPTPDDTALPSELRVLLTCVALTVAAVLCRSTDLGQPRSLLLFVVLTVVACTGLPWRAAVLVGASAWAVHTGFVVDRLGVLHLSGARLTELLLFLGVASLSWLAGRVHDRGRP